MRKFGERGSTWWYDSGSGWDGGDKGGIGVLFLRRALSDCIVSVSE